MSQHWGVIFIIIEVSSYSLLRLRGVLFRSCPLFEVLFIWRCLHLEVSLFGGALHLEVLDLHLEVLDLHLEVPSFGGVFIRRCCSFGGALHHMEVSKTSKI